MKKTLLFLIVLCSTISCQEAASPTSSVTGKWEWVSTSGGFAAHILDTPASTGKKVQLDLNSDNRFTFFTNGKASEQGTYYLANRKCIHDHLTKQVIIFSTGEEWMIEKQEENQLYLSDERYDGISSHYKKGIRAGVSTNG